MKSIEGTFLKPEHDLKIQQHQVFLMQFFTTFIVQSNDSKFETGRDKVAEQQLQQEAKMGNRLLYFVVFVVYCYLLQLKAQHKHCRCLNIVNTSGSVRQQSNHLCKVPASLSCLKLTTVQVTHVDFLRKYPSD